MSKQRRLFPMMLLPLLLAAPSPAGATAVCEQLRENLAGSRQVIGSTAEARRYAQTISQINLEIRRVRSDLRRSGCSQGSIVVIGGDSEADCAAAAAALRQMEAQKQALMRKRNDLRPGTGNGGRNGILAALRQNGCTEPDGVEPTLVAPEDLRMGIDDPEAETEGGRVPIFGAIARQPSGLLQLDTTPDQGSLRTLCVRTCDGAFFPISSNATPQSFGRDASTCAQMCPGTQTELYYHSMFGAESADMVSAATGQPYTALPTAFSYRNRQSSKDSACGCNLSAYYQEMLRREKAGRSPAESGYKAVTEIHSEPAIEAGTDPGTGKAGTAIVLPGDRPYDPANTKIRQVGPQFLGDDSARIDLRNPRDAGPQPLQQ